MFSCVSVLSASRSDRAARATLKPLEAKVLATACPILGPAPRIRMTGDVPGMILSKESGMHKVLKGVV
jgi:hypothetical protein